MREEFAARCRACAVFGGRVHLARAGKLVNRPALSRLFGRPLRLRGLPAGGAAAGSGSVYPGPYEARSGAYFFTLRVATTFTIVKRVAASTHLTHFGKGVVHGVDHTVNGPKPFAKQIAGQGCPQKEVDAVAMYGVESVGMIHTPIERGGGLDVLHVFDLHHPDTIVGTRAGSAGSRNIETLRGGNCVDERGDTARPLTRASSIAEIDCLL